MLRSLARQQDRILVMGTSLLSDFRQQFHQNLSPLGWHCGHCAHTENFWLMQAGAGSSTLDEPCDSTAIFSTHGIERERRAPSLPPASELLLWLKNCMLDNQRRLEQLFEERVDNELLRRHFLLHFLTEHAAQHAETMVMVATQKAQPEYHARHALARCDSLPEFVLMPKACHDIGMAAGKHGYDNEKGCHVREIEAVYMASAPVSNSMWLAFMQAGGYGMDSLWSAAGVKARERGCWQMPGFWRRDGNGLLHGISAYGPVELDPAAPVTGVSLYEAQAYAAWVGARLPHEYEWEAACKVGLLGGAGVVWEWCGNAFHPYPGFRAFPYEGYSVPYFDGKHHVLRGGSIHTSPRLKRPSFRNFYTPETRHLYSGVRLARDA